MAISITFIKASFDIFISQEMEWKWQVSREKLKTSGFALKQEQACLLIVNQWSIRVNIVQFIMNDTVETSI